MATTKARMNFVQLTQTIYNGLDTRDANTLYFCTDTNRIYLGTALMSRPAQVVGTLPESGQLLNTVYIKTTDGTIWYYDGTKYNKVGGSDAAVTSVSVADKKLKTVTAGGTAVEKVIGGLFDSVTYANGVLTIKTTTDDSEVLDEKTVNIPVEQYLSAVSRKEVALGDLSGPDASVYDGCEAGDIGVLFTMADGTKMFVKLTDLVDTYTSASGEKDIVKVVVSGYGISATLNFANTDFETDGTTGALKIKAARVKEIVAVTDAVENNLVAFDASGNSKDSGKKVGGATISVTPDANTLATEAAVSALAAAKMAKQTSATENNVVLFGTGGEVKDGGYHINTTSNYEDSNSASDKVLVTEKTLSGVVSKVVAGDMGDVLKGKLDNVEAGKADEIVTATATGGVKVSGKKVGGATLATTADANTVATEAAVKAAIEDAISWTIMTE